jgi:hypothetical protein
MTKTIEKSQIERATVWAIVGIIVTVIVAVPGIYFAMKSPKPSVRYSIVYESNVLDVHNPLKDLTILYRGEDLRAQKKNLRIIRVKVVNNGQVDIKQGDFDQTEPWGLQLKNAQLVETPRILESNSDYILSKLAVTQTNNVIEFTKVIFEREKFFTLELQVLHDIGQTPELSVVGKIVGIEKQIVVRETTEKASPSFWGQVFSAPTALVQTVRVLTYGLGGILVFAGVIIVLFTIDDAREKRKKRKLAKRTQGYLGDALQNKTDADEELMKSLFESARGRVETLKQMRETVTSEGGLQQLAAQMRSMHRVEPGVDVARRRAFRQLMNWPKGFISYDSRMNKVNVDKANLRLLNELIQYVESHPPDASLLEGLAPASPHMIVDARGGVVTIDGSWTDIDSAPVPAPDVRIVGLQYAPMTVGRGGQLTLTYTIESQADIPEGIWLGANLTAAGKNMIFNTKEDKPVQIQAGNHNYSRVLTIPADSSAGTYKLTVGVWLGPVGDSKKSRSLCRHSPAVSITVQ